VEIRILIVEDDQSISDIVKKFLVKEGYLVEVCHDGDEALERIYDNSYHLLMLDIMLPGADGHEILKEYRKLSDAPVLMMTALDDDGNEIRAFTNEADDYITKPFSMQVMVKRVEALLRRTGFLKKEICVGKLTLLPESHKAVYAGADIAITPKEYDILMLLAQNAGKVIPHETLLTRIWGYNFDGNEGVVHTTMKRLRDKLPASVIKTVKGVGYCLEGG